MWRNKCMESLVCRTVTIDMIQTGGIPKTLNRIGGEAQIGPNFSVYADSRRVVANAKTGLIL